MAKGKDPANDADLLSSEARVLAYLRAAMLEFGDDPKAMEAAMRTVEIARANLQRRGPMRISGQVIEMYRHRVKRSP